jgi:hypothetical protein
MTPTLTLTLTLSNLFPLIVIGHSLWSPVFLASIRSRVGVSVVIRIRVGIRVRVGSKIRV